MRYDDKNRRLELSTSELSGSVAALDLALGPIAPARLGGATPGDIRAFEDGLAALSDEARDVLESSLGRLADPRKSLKVAVAGGEAWLHRAVYTWSDGGVTALASRGGMNVIGAVDADELTGVLTGALLSNQPAIPGDTRVEMDGRGVLALVGAADALRYARLASLAAHTPPPESVNAAEIAARLRDSKLDDPRWSTSLFASVLPFDASEFMDAPTIDLAMGRLAEAGFFAVTERSGAFPAHYAPTDEGLVIAETLSESSGRAAITVFSRPGDEIAYESMLLARGPHLLLALTVSPGGGGVTALSTGAFTSLLSRLVE